MENKKNDKFEVKFKESGQRHSFGDSYYTFEIKSAEPENVVKEYCMNVLHKSYEEKDMPDPFVGELISFEKITDNNKDNPNERKSETYIYKLKEMYTD